MNESCTITLSDGRRLGWAEYGDPSGDPVLYFHGGLSSRLDARPHDALCLERKVRLIAIDRPGIGNSTFQVGRRLSDWPGDVAQLLKALSIDRAAVIGWSGGGPYVVACANAIPARVTWAATMAGMAPLDFPGAVSELGLWADRLLFPLARRAPALCGLVLKLVQARGREAARREMLAACSSPADRRTVEKMTLADSTDFLFEAMRRGPRGTVHDYRIMGSSWEIDLRNVRFPITVWQGDEDKLLPMSHARRLASTLGNAKLAVVPGAGHFLPHQALSLVLDAARASTENST